MRLCPRTITAAASIVLGLAGCGITNPYQPAHPAADRPSTPAATAARPVPADAGDPAPERDGTIPARPRAAQSRFAPGAGQPTPQRTLARYARLYVNWQASTLPAHERALAAISLGQARAQALQAAASATTNPQLTASQVANHGQVVALTPGQGAAAHKWVVVTRETTTGHGDYTGLPPTLHVTYATVTHTPTGWVISSWLPQT